MVVCGKSIPAERIAVPRPSGGAAGWHVCEHGESQGGRGVVVEKERGRK